MYNTAHFSRMPRANIPATRIRKPQPNVGTSLHGKIVPLFCNMVMPGQIDSNFCNGVIWMSNPIHPILSNIKGKINVFFIPMRLVWEHTKEFFGENTTSSGPQRTDYKIPSNNYSSLTTSGNLTAGSVSHYLHKPIYDSDDSDGSYISVLKERAFWLVYSEYFRHEQTMNPVILDRSDDGNIGTLNGVDLMFDTECPNCLKDFDYFTTATISPAFGGEVLLPLGSVAPVHLYGAAGFDQDDPTITGFEAKEASVEVGSPAKYLTEIQAVESGSVTGQLYADLSQATAAKLDDLYTAMAANAWYHNANYGSRYFAMLEVHYGVSNPDLVLDRPEHISEFTFDIVIQDVVSTAGASADTSTKLGQPGAFSKTVIRKQLYNHSFGEWGFVLGVMNTYHERYYSAGALREDLYEDLFDLYFPEFANRSDDSVFDDELFFGAGRGAFGYQEAYADRKYYLSTVTGELDPMLAAPLGPWVLAEKYTEKPTLSASFLEENRDAISEALVSGEDGPDYIWAFNFVHKEVLPMPAYSKPGIPRFGRI